MSPEAFPTANRIEACGHARLPLLVVTTIPQHSLVSLPFLGSVKVEPGARGPASLGAAHNSCLLGVGHLPGLAWGQVLVPRRLHSQFWDLLSTLVLLRATPLLGDSQCHLFKSSGLWITKERKGSSLWTASAFGPEVNISRGPGFLNESLVDLHI